VKFPEATRSDLHRLGDRSAHGPGEADRKHDPDQDRCYCKHKQGGTGGRDRRFRVLSIFKAIGGDPVDKAIKGDGGVVALLRDSECRRDRRKTVGRRVQKLQFGVGPIANPALCFRQRSFDIVIFDALANDLQVFGYFGDHGLKCFHRIVPAAAATIGRHKDTSFA